MAAVILLIVAALNLALVALLNINAINWLFGPWPLLEKIVYVTIGLAAVYKLYVLTIKCR